MGEPGASVFQKVINILVLFRIKKPQNKEFINGLQSLGLEFVACDSIFFLTYVLVGREYCTVYKFVLLCFIE